MFTLLSAALDDIAPDVRAAAVRAMTACGTQRFAESLRRAAADAHYQVRLTAEAALTDLAGA